VGTTVRPAVPLRPRERALIQLVLSACSNKEIASVLGLAESSVETYLSRLYERLGVRSRLELALRAEHERWLGTSEPAFSTHASRIPD
jgi:two-component system competent response regulator ComA